MPFDTPTLDTLWNMNLQLALPAIWLATSVLILLLVDIFLPEERKYWTPILALSFISMSFIFTLLNYSPTETTAFGGMFATDAFTNFMNIVVLGTAFISILLSYDYLKTANIGHGEFYSLLLLSSAGAMFMAGANDLVMIFVSLELLSIPLYVMAAFRATDPDHISRTSGLRSVGDVDNQILKSEESGMKYFILGAFSSAFLVYGSALIYGATGTTNLPEIFAGVKVILAADAMSPIILLLAGTSLAVVGLGFKIAAVPFHMWTPDVYEGAPTPVTAYMSVVAKVGGFAALLRLMLVGLSEFSIVAADPAAWTLTLQVIAAATLILGNVMALAQSNIKRMLAYSSIAHAGYILMAIASIGATGVDDIIGVGTIAAQAVAVYMIAYMFTNLGAFGVVQALENKDGSGTNIRDFAGLYKTKPMLAVAMTVFMLSLTGIPLTGGFLGKFLVFGAAIHSRLYILAVIGVLTSVISAFYYMNVVVNMFLKDEAEGSAAVGATQPVTLAIYAAMAGTLATGIIVPLVINLANMIQFG